MCSGKDDFFFLPDFLIQKHPLLTELLFQKYFCLHNPYFGIIQNYDIFSISKYVGSRKKNVGCMKKNSQ